MTLRLSPALIATLAVSGLITALAGCDKKADPQSETPVAATTATPAADPAAPAPGTQAAEAIGADSSSDAPMVPPEKQPH
ncbi:hypothetical protein BH10PSE1_BH10PSE1_11450 [soil metagenome]